VIRVVLADDQSVVRAGFRVILELAGDIAVVGECADGPTAVRLARRLAPDVVCMDVRMPGGDGLAATREITSGEAHGPRQWYGRTRPGWGALHTPSDDFTQRPPCVKFAVGV
jgi:DNA-binding NarL/FixJ family response regulator